MGPQSPFSLTPWVRRLIVANLLVYVLQLTVFTGPWIFLTYGFDPLRALGRPWTFVTYLFLHQGFLHIAFNLLMLFMFGPAVEAAMGGRRFSLYYLWCGLGGAVLALLIQFFVTEVTPFVGASGALFGVALAFAWRWPDAPVYIFPLPVPVKVKWLVVFLVALDLVLAKLAIKDGVAHLAHLGGFAFGFFYLKGEQLLLARAERTVRRSSQSNVLVHPAAARAQRGSGPARRAGPARTPDDSTLAEVDRVLDKISAAGIQSLTPEERRFLVEMSRKMRHEH